MQMASPGTWAASRDSEAEDKLSEQESRLVLHIVNQKNFQAKDEAKLATTDLKERNTVNDEKVNRVNKAFVDIQKEAAHMSQSAFLSNLCRNSWFLSKVMKENQLMLMKLQVWWRNCNTLVMHQIPSNDQ